MPPALVFLIRVLAGGLGECTSIERNAPALAFEPHDGRVSAQNLGEISCFAQPMRGLSNDRVIFNESSHGNRSIPIGHALFELLQVWRHAITLSLGTFKRYRPLVPVLAGGNA